MLGDGRYIHKTQWGLEDGMLCGERLTASGVDTAPGDGKGPKSELGKTVRKARLFGEECSLSWATLVT